MPPAEIILWQELKGKQLKGYKFRRQYGIGNFVVDFYCPEMKIAIEIDGNSHFGDKEEIYDQKRQEFIEKFGINFLCFTNLDIYYKIESVIEKIEKILP